MPTTTVGVSTEFSDIGCCSVPPLPGAEKSEVGSLGRWAGFVGKCSKSAQPDLAPINSSDADGRTPEVIETQHLQLPIGPLRKEIVFRAARESPKRPAQGPRPAA